MQQYDLINITEAAEYIIVNNLKLDRNIQDWTQFRNCQAWYMGGIFYNDAGRYEIYFLQSYNTVVAIWNKTTGELIKLDWSKYTDHKRTTSKQITQWSRFMERGW